MNIESISQTFKALSDPIRLRIVYLLLEKESLCVCEVVETLELSQSTVSRHLAYLKNSGLVRSWREGIWMHYALQAEALQMMKISKLKTVLEETAEITSDKQKIKCDGLTCSTK